MLLKVCGITRTEDAKAAFQGGADLCGLIFAKSPRQVSQDQAREIIQAVGRPDKFVGVFVNETADPIIALLKNLGMKWAQLHGDETPETALQLRKTGHYVIKAARVQSARDIDCLINFPAEYLLLDSFSEGMSGGTGKSFNWKVLKEFKTLPPFFLSGGISLQNIETAVREIRPAGIDVSSSLESRPGEKDPVKLEAFLKKVEELRYA